MPEIIPLGWFHTIVAIFSLICAFITLKNHKVISTEPMTGKLYIGGTVIVAATALMISQHGGFGVAHGLAVLTLIAIAGGLITEKTNLFKGLSPYLQAVAYSATVLFHMIPAITDGLMRLPVGNPVVTELEDPLLRGFYLAFLVCYVVGVTLQLRWLKGQAR